MQENKSGVIINSADELEKAITDWYSDLDSDDDIEVITQMSVLNKYRFKLQDQYYEKLDKIKIAIKEVIDKIDNDQPRIKSKEENQNAISSVFVLQEILNNYKWSCTDRKTRETQFVKVNIDTLFNLELELEKAAQLKIEQFRSRIRNSIT